MASEIAVALSQLVNSALGGSAQETLSSRCWRSQSNQPYHTLRRLIDGVFIWEPDHCQASYESWLARNACAPTSANPAADNAASL